MSPFLEKFWKEVCVREFPRLFPEKDENWLEFYHRQLDSTKSKIQAAGSRLRDSYRGEGTPSYVTILFTFVLERKVHQLQTITVAPKRARLAFSAASMQAGAKRSSLMEKSRQEAMNSSTRTGRSPNKAVVTFRMRQPPSQKR